MPLRSPAPARYQIACRTLPSSLPQAVAAAPEETLLTVDDVGPVVVVQIGELDPGNRVLTESGIRGGIIPMGRFPGTGDWICKACTKKKKESFRHFQIVRIVVLCS